MMIGRYYAHIDIQTRMCIGIAGTNREVNREDLIYIGNKHIDTYLGKYYYESQWWERKFDGESYTDVKFVLDVD